MDSVETFHPFECQQCAEVMFSITTILQQATKCITFT